jgi:hypothetical protein
MGFKNSLKGLSVRAKVLASFFIPFFIGLLCYVLLSYLNYSSSTSLDFSQSYKNIQEAYQGQFIIAMIIYSILILTYLGVFLGTMFRNLNEKTKAVTLILTFISIAIWLTYFIRNYYYYQNLLSPSKKSFICSTTRDKCITDGTFGPYFGIKPYIFNPPNSKEVKSFIPSNQLNNDSNNTSNLTLSFWLKVDYKLWKLPRFFGKDKVVLTYGDMISVWLLPNINKIQINYLDNIKYVTEFDFDKWYQYSIVIDTRTLQFYKNARLEKSNILDNDFTFTRRNIYIGKNSNSSYRFFPGYLSFLTFYNDSLNINNLQKDYTFQYNKIKNISDNLNRYNLRNIRKEDCKTCENRGGICPNNKLLCRDNENCCGPEDIENIIWNAPRYIDDYPDCESTWRDKTSNYYSNNETWENSLKKGLHDSIIEEKCPDVNNDKDINFNAINSYTYSHTYNYALCPKNCENRGDICKSNRKICRNNPLCDDE